MKSIWFMAAVALVALAAPARAQAPAPSTIRVFGEATVSAKPDVAELDLGVVSSAASASAAATDNARKMEKIVAALKKEVGAAGEVRTASFTVSQRYGQPRPGQDNPAVVGYLVSNVVHVRLPDINAVGRLVDLSLKLGANEVQRASFSIRDPEAPHAEALRAAALKARAHATALAAALGLRLGPLVSISEGSPGPVPFLEERDKVATMARTATPVEAGTLELHASVTAVFATGAK
jgi:uncharacterized protein YggE